MFDAGSGPLDPGNGDDGGPPDTGASDSGDGDGAGDTDTGGDDGPRFDVGDGDGDGEGPSGDDGATKEGCDKIDFLFVVDNSGSMYDEQQNLAASVPGFLDTIEMAVETDDIHVMVVDSDAAFAQTGPSITCSFTNCCDTACMSAPTGICNGVPCGPPPPPPDPSNCDNRLGAGRISDGAGTTCGMPAGQRFIDGVGPDLNSSFTCAANQGIAGHGDEKPMEALVNALTTETAPGACNEGFLRDDAVLVVTVITDEEDDLETASGACAMGMPTATGSAGDPNSWAQAVIDAKGGVESNAVVLSLVGPTGAAACPALDKCNGGLIGAEPAPRIEAFTAAFSRGSVGPVCASSYDQFFADAVSIVTDACNDFVPPAG